MRLSRLALLALASLSCLGASRCTAFGPGSERGGRSLSILDYNVHNLFDAVDDGSEYAEFSVARGRWDEGRYRARLALVAEVVRAALPEGGWPDLLCLEEIEGRRVLDDLASGPLKAGGYRHIGVAPASGSPINCGILSRLPIRSLKAHGLASGGESPAAPTRSLLEASLDRGAGGMLTVFVLHWKSRVEGAQQTEGLRRESAALLSARVSAVLAADPDAELLACGDFNESPDEFYRVGRRYPTALFPEAEAGGSSAAGGPGASRVLVAADPSRARSSRGGEPVLYSPWAADSGYSYSYKGGRERLDGFLLAPGLLDDSGLRLRGFGVVDESFLMDAAGEPIAWSSSTAKGYSDHLPILLVLEEAGG